MVQGFIPVSYDGELVFIWVVAGHSRLFVPDCEEAYRVKVSVLCLSNHCICRSALSQEFWFGF